MPLNHVHDNGAGAPKSDIWQVNRLPYCIYQFPVLYFHQHLVGVVVVWNQANVAKLCSSQVVISIFPVISDW